MNAGMPIALREKYGLVHVPGARRCSDWAARARREIDAGLPPERAGLQAARAVFPYEAREIPLAGTVAVADLLTMAQ